MQAETTDTKKYSWSYKDGRMHCCTSETSTCTVSKLWEVAQLTSFHDAKLQEATKEINAILEGVRKGRRDEKRELCLIQIEDRHFLVWSEEGFVGPHDDDKTVRKMLRLKAK
jgi:hypothetical protein